MRSKLNSTGLCVCDVDSKTGNCQLSSVESARVVTFEVTVGGETKNRYHMFNPISRTYRKRVLLFYAQNIVHFLAELVPESKKTTEHNSTKQKSIMNKL